MEAKQFAAGRRQLIEKFGRQLAEGEKPKEYLKALGPLLKYAKVDEDRLTTSIIGDWIVEHPEWKNPNFISSDYAVFQDAERHTCIRVEVSKKSVSFIPMNTMLEVFELSHMEFEKRYVTHLHNYPVKRAAELYRGAAWLAVSEEAKEHLDHILGNKFKDPVMPLNFQDKESIMATAPKKPATKKPTASKEEAAPAKVAKFGKSTKEAVAEKAVKVAAPKKEAPAKAEKTKAVKVAAPAKKEAAAKKPSGPDTRKITILAEENPKRGGAAERFALYKNGMTVDKYVTAGGKAEDISWDVKKGFISVE